MQTQIQPTVPTGFMGEFTAICCCGIQNARNFIIASSTYSWMCVCFPPLCPSRAEVVFNCSCSSSEPLGVFLSSSFAQACFWNQQTAHYTGISNPSKRTGNLSSQVLLLVKRRSVKCNSPCDWLHCCSSGLFTHQSVRPTRSGGWKDGWMCIQMSCLPLRPVKQAHWSAGMKKFSL